MTYKEHEKLSAVSEKSQTVGEFLDWMSDVKGIVRAEYLDIGVDEYDESVLVTSSVGIQDLLADFFDIDRTKIEEEKREMLESLREQNKAGQDRSG